MKESIVTFFLCCLFFISVSYAQGFDASVIMGVNAAQLDGDELAGYSKLGIHGGLRVSYPFKEKTDLGLELIFSQRGSRSSRGTDPANVFYTNLDYLSVPFFATYKDWYLEEEDYYKVRAEGGVVYSYLFDVDSNYDPFLNGLEDFRRHDVGIHLGLSYAISKRWNFTTRWTRSLLKLYTNDMIPPVISYYLTFRFEYNL